MDSQVNQAKNESAAVAFKITSVLAACFLFSVIFLTVLPQINLIQPQNQSEQSVVTIFFVLAVLLSLLGFFIRRSLLKKSLAQNKDKEISVLLKILNVHFVITFAIFEAIAILSLVSYTLGGRQTDSLVMGLVSIGSMILAWPKKKEFEQL